MNEKTRVFNNDTKNPHWVFKEMQMEYISARIRAAIHIGADRLYWLDYANKKRAKIKEFQIQNPLSASIFTNDFVREKYAKAIVGKWGFPYLAYQKGTEETQRAKDMEAYYMPGMELHLKENPEDANELERTVRCRYYSAEKGVCGVVTAKDELLVRPLENLRRFIVFKFD